MGRVSAARGDPRPGGRQDDPAGAVGRRDRRSAAIATRSTAGNDDGRSGDLVRVQAIRRLAPRRGRRAHSAVRSTATRRGAGLAGRPRTAARTRPGRNGHGPLRTPPRFGGMGSSRRGPPRRGSTCQRVPLLSGPNDLQPIWLAVVQMLRHSPWVPIRLSQPQCCSSSGPSYRYAMDLRGPQPSMKGASNVRARAASVASRCVVAATEGVME